MLPSFRTISHQHKLQVFFPAFPSLSTFSKQAEPKPLLNTLFYHPHIVDSPFLAQGQAGWGWEEPGLGEGASVHGRGLEQGGL